MKRDVRRIPLFLCTKETQEAFEKRKNEFPFMGKVRYTLIEKIQVFWYQSVINRYKGILFWLKGIGRVFKWYNTVASTRDWDYIYLLMIHKKVLEGFLEDQIKSEYMNTEGIIKDLKICIEILDRFIGDEYHLRDHIFEMNSNRKKQHMEMYFRLLNKRIFSLWS